MKTHISGIEAQKAFLIIGVDLTTNPIMANNVDVPWKHLFGCFTLGFLGFILATTVRTEKPRRGRKQSGKAGETCNGGQTDESEA